MQVMKAAPPFAEPDLYFQCADIALRTGGGPDPVGPDAGPGPDPDPDPDPQDPATATGGCSTGSPGGIASALLLLAAALTFRRRVVARPRTER
jgi:uncharacterized protein (TIGR03382 family)